MECSFKIDFNPSCMYIKAKQEPLAELSKLSPQNIIPFFEPFYIQMIDKHQD